MSLHLTGSSWWPAAARRFGPRACWIWPTAWLFCAPRALRPVLRASRRLRHDCQGDHVIVVSRDHEAVPRTTTGRPGPEPESPYTATLVPSSTSCGSQTVQASGPPPDTATRCRTAPAADHDHAAQGPPDHRSGHTVQSGGLPVLSS